MVFQDAFGMIPLNPQMAREQILRVASFVFSDGSPCDVTSRIEYKAHKGTKVDVPLWMALATCNYIKETSEWGILDEKIPYLDGGEGTLYEHILKGIKRVAKEPGIHGLPLFGGGDWNDALNRVGDKGKGESTWLAQFIFFSIREIQPLMEYKKDVEKIVYFKEIADNLQVATKDPDTYKVEPYIYSQFAAGPDSRDYGRGGYHWMTGTAAWMFRVVLDYMLGIQPDYKGLRINPCIPSEWKEYTVKRNFRGDMYNITVKNPDKVQTGVKKIIIDGKEYNNQVITPIGDGKQHQVEVIMG